MMRLPFAALVVLAFLSGVLVANISRTDIQNPVLEDFLLTQNLKEDGLYGDQVTA